MREEIVEKNILVVEDNEMNMKLVRDVLSFHGYTTVEATDGPQGLDLARKLRPALILMDIQLPGMDGYQVMKKIRSDLPIAETPIIAITGFAMETDRIRAREAGCNDFLAKPLHIDTLISLVQRYIGSPD